VAEVCEGAARGIDRAVRKVFSTFAKVVARAAGTPWAFAAAVLLIAAWAVTGPIFGFSDTWQLVINTSTTIVTFVMVFLIQNTQNRDSEAVHAKLDDLIQHMEGARNSLEHIEDLPLEEIRAQRD
jgi:low affinity Fe/Cu permease